MSTDDIVEDSARASCSATGEPLRDGKTIDSATLVYVSFDAPQPVMATRVTNELVGP